MIEKRRNLKDSKIRVFFVLLVLLSFANVCTVYSGVIEEALKQAKEEDKKVIIDVYTDWCGWCKKMDRDTYLNKDIKRLIDDNFIYVKLNAEGTARDNYDGKSYSGSELASYFQVSGFPTHVFLEPDGKIIEFKYDKYRMINIPGYFGAEDFKKILEFVRDEKYKDSDLSTVI